jgi:hypothetical protein
LALTIIMRVNAMTISFSPNLLSDLQSILQYQFMQHAFEAGTIIAIVAGIIGYFVILRRSAFAAHALSEIGFAGAAGAVLVGINPIFGLLSFSTVSGTGIAILGKRATHRDIEIGSVLAFALGLGVLFISLYTGYATEAYSILFGEILGISSSNVLITLVLSLVVLAGAALIYRPLLFASLDEQVAPFPRCSFHAASCCSRINSSAGCWSAPDICAYSHACSHSNQADKKTKVCHTDLSAYRIGCDMGRALHLFL